MKSGQIVNRKPETTEPSSRMDKFSFARIPATHFRKEAGSTLNENMQRRQQPYQPLPRDTSSKYCASYATEATGYR